jgi:hypothetical protein
MVRPAGRQPVDSAIRMLTVPDGEDPWHRDGWVFQCVSWIVAAESRVGPLRPPQMSHAEKGFDGLQLQLSSDSSRLVRVLVFEDKATENPRKTVRDKIWPELKALEAGDKDNALTAELTYLRMPTRLLQYWDPPPRFLNPRS